MDKELLSILACPFCKADVKHHKNKLICVKCKKEYLIKDDVPIMI
ncbi:MAG TPA: Trm112 family protein [Candidatus Nanoarchaeia archaeon]|nr:Trm112 family protein [Candidatus Nanoarchaeia archaeon]